MTTAVLLDTDMSAWAPVTKHYQAGDTYLAVTVDEGLTHEVAGYVDQTLTAMGQPALQVGACTILTSPTVILECLADGAPIDLTPDHVSPPGTSHEDALVAAGYTL
jgi:hypothetical protein